jgi:hypothetical protein
MVTIGTGQEFIRQAERIDVASFDGMRMAQLRGLVDEAVKSGAYGGAYRISVMFPEVFTKPERISLLNLRNEKLKETR